MLVSAIDIGTNTLRLLIKDKKTDAILFRKNFYLLLGKTCKDGYLTEKGIKALKEALLEIKEILKSYNINECFGVATAFARNIKNSEKLFQIIEGNLPCRLMLIDGITEGKIVARAVSERFVLKGNYSVIDIGGGSTEFISQHEGKLFVKSLDFGSLYLSRNFFIGDPPTTGEMRRLVDFVNSALNELSKFNLPQPCYGVGGTITTLAFLLSGLKEYEVDIINGYEIGLKEVRDFFDEVKLLSQKELLSRYPLEKGRETVLLSGILILLAIMERFCLEKVFASDVSLIDGVISYFESINENAFSS